MRPAAILAASAVAGGLALGSVAANAASSRQFMRVGASGTTIASLSAERTVGRVRLRGMARLKFTATISALVQTATTDANYNTVLGPVVPWMQGSASLSYSVTCKRRKPFDFKYRSGTHQPVFGGTASTTVRLPLRDAGSCDISISGTAYTDGVTYPASSKSVSYVVTVDATK